MHQFKNNYTQKKTTEAEKLLREWPELQAFGVEWVRKWLDLRDRLVEIAKVLRRFPWMADAIRQRPMNILHPYMIEAYAARDGSDVCLSLTSSKAYCAQNGAAREVKLELEFSRYETYGEKIREVYRPKGLLAFTTTAREYVRLLLPLFLPYIFASKIGVLNCVYLVAVCREPDAEICEKRGNKERRASLRRDGIRTTHPPGGGFLFFHPRLGIV